MSAFTFNTAASIQFGAGLLDEIGARAAPLGGRILIITDAGLRKTDIVARAEQALADAGRKVAIYDGIIADPPEAVVRAATEVSHDFASAPLCMVPVRIEVTNASPTDAFEMAFDGMKPTDDIDVGLAILDDCLTELT